MKQDVNLYQAGLQPQKSQPTAIGALAVCVAVLCLISGISLYMHSRTTALSQSRDRVLERKEELARNVAELRKKARERDDRELRKRIRRLEAKARARRKLLDVISRRDTSRRNDFTPFLRAMARQHVPELWLTRFRIDLEDPSLRLSGRTTESEQIPNYLLRLSREEVFNGLTFRKLRAERLEKQPDLVAFTLASDTGSE